MQAALCSAVEVQAAAAVFVLFSHTATLSLPCKGISLPVVQFQLPLCPAHTIYLFLCVHWVFFLKRKRYVQRKKDAQKQTKTSCSPVVSKTFCGKRNLCGYKLWVKVVCWQPLKESGEIVLKCFVRSSDKNLWCLWVCRGFEGTLHTRVAFPVAVLNCQLCNWLFFMLLRKALRIADFLQ